MKIATWNVNSLTVRLPQVLDWLNKHNPDVLALQEIKMLDEKFPLAALNEIGYQAVFKGQATYNGVAIISRNTPHAVQKSMPDFTDPQSRLIAATIDGLRIINVYIPNGQSPESEKYTYKLNWLTQLNAYLKEALRQHPRLVILGDFNIAPEDRDVHDPLLWANQVLCTDQERAHFKNFQELGLVDSLRIQEQTEPVYSWWDYRQAAFPRNRGMRIDHILVSPDLSNSVTKVSVDTEPRKNERPSDHAPVILELRHPSEGWDDIRIKPIE
jgi:exodeoxyribonuclease-3